MKLSSMEWCLQNKSGPIKAKTRLSAGKVLLDYRGVVYTDTLFDQRTINAADYCKLLDKVKTTYWPKRRDVLICSVLLLQDKTMSHTCLLYTSRCV